MERQRGRVKWFDNRKGIGFIRRPGQPDVFVHFSQIIAWGRRTLDPGEEVEFGIEERRRGPAAVDVIRL